MKVLVYPEMTWSEETVCKKCSAKLLVETQDIVRESQSPNRLFAVCPVCHERAYAKEETLPWFVQAYARGQHVGWPPGKKPKQQY